MRKIGRQLLNLMLMAAIIIGSFSADSLMSQAADGRAGAVKSEDVKAGSMKVHFMDVGQGDATLIVCDGHSMLIDAGDYTKGTAIQNYLKKQKIEKLDYLIFTHPDADHIGGAPVIITKFDIDRVFLSNFEKDNKTYQKMIQALDNKHLKYTTPKIGTQYSLGSAKITILAPNGSYDNPNDASVALTVEHGENRFLFTGDAEEAAEKDIMANGIDISADVYKAGHHGSRTSTSKEFFEAVDPAYAVISCGEENSYGHPHAETLNTFRMNGVDVYRTDEEGTIVAVSDGKEITFNVPASETWKAGEPNGNTSVWEVPDKNSENQDASVVTEPEKKEDHSDTKEVTYVLNTKTKKFHRPSCNSLPTVNRKDSTESREDIMAQGYVPCKRCNP